MMDKNKVCTVDDLFALFADVLSPADVLSAKLMGQISSAITKERLDLNLTQKEFASYIDATQSLVSVGSVVITIFQLIKLRKLLQNWILM